MYAAHRVVQSRMSNAKAEQPSPGAGPKSVSTRCYVPLSCADGLVTRLRRNLHSQTAPTSAGAIMKRRRPTSSVGTWD